MMRGEVSGRHVLRCPLHVRQHEGARRIGGAQASGCRDGAAWRRRRLGLGRCGWGLGGEHRVRGGHQQRNCRVSHRNVPSEVRSMGRASTPRGELSAEAVLTVILIKGRPKDPTIKLSHGMCFCIMMSFAGRGSRRGLQGGRSDFAGGSTLRDDSGPGIGILDSRVGDSGLGISDQGPKCYASAIGCAKVAELADAPDLGSGSRKAMGVRLPPFALLRSRLRAGLPAVARRAEAGASECSPAREYPP